MIRRPPISTLFPYTRSSDLDDRGELRSGKARVGPAHVTEEVDGARHTVQRSEEHTSELQSRENLVCRLLLEKKKRAPACTWPTPSRSPHCSLSARRRARSSL